MITLWVYILISTFLLVLQTISSLLHINKIFEVGLSEYLLEKMENLQLDLLEKV